MEQQASEEPKVGPAIHSGRTEQQDAHAYVTGHLVKRVGYKDLRVDEVRVRWERSGGRDWQLAHIKEGGTVLNADGTYVSDGLYGDELRSSIVFDQLDAAPRWLREWAEQMRPMS